MLLGTLSNQTTNIARTFWSLLLLQTQRKDTAGHATGRRRDRGRRIQKPTEKQGLTDTNNNTRRQHQMGRNTYSSSKLTLSKMEKGVCFTETCKAKKFASIREFFSVRNSVPASPLPAFTASLAFVKASASRAEDPGFESRLRRNFSGVESYQ